MNIFAYLAKLALAVVHTTTLMKHSAPQGIDVSSNQPNIDWQSVANNGIAFAYIKATEGTYYISPTFNSQYTGATKAKLIRGSYHFARPDTTTGAVQAKYFIAHGGGWSADGITLPGALDIEANPYGSECYGLTASEMVSWIKDFSNTYHSATSRYPVIYTSVSWWETCTGNSGAFGEDNPLWIAHWASSPDPLPNGWSYATFWQYADHGANPGDADLFNGDMNGLKSMAIGHPVLVQNERF